MATTNPTSVNDNQQCLQIFCNLSASMKNRSESAKIDAMNAQKLTDLFVNQFQSPQMNPSQPNNITPLPSLALGDMFAPTDVSPTDDAASATAKLSAATAASASTPLVAYGATTPHQFSFVVSDYFSGLPEGTTAVYPVGGNLYQNWMTHRVDKLPKKYQLFFECECEK